MGAGVRVSECVGVLACTEDSDEHRCECEQATERKTETESTRDALAVRTLSPFAHPKEPNVPTILFFFVIRQPTAAGMQGSRVI